MNTARTCHRLRVLLAGFLISATALNALAKTSCSISDFERYWIRTFEIYLSDTLAKHKAPPQIINGTIPNIFWQEALDKTLIAKVEFSMLLEGYPELCQLTSLPFNSLSRAMIPVMIYERNSLSLAIERKQLSANDFAEMALTDPHLATNLLGHMDTLSESVHSLKIRKEQLPYFQRLARALVKDQSSRLEANRAYSKAFCHLILMINEGRSEADLDRYSRVVSSLHETEFPDFLLLDPHSSSSIEFFLNRIELTHITPQDNRYPMTGIE
ncbi:hypothetical protein [Endozoicomonas numazuensis]|uniref:Uncharacterized protein n=1 Tax=Endozoicomonas numazuensis TaxID=1137799 RepID=A0A081NFY7_9GAMM|nr:hypothetical protein [Endozoicomonas numazuensis]KEQ17360.1 hypothetical protein GZ78_16295 [Endozoicomonas numazuensis]